MAVVDVDHVSLEELVQGGAILQVELVITVIVIAADR